MLFRSNQVDKVKKAGVLKVALSPDYPPFEFQIIKDGKNTVVGSDVDLANAIGKKLGVKVKIESMDFNNVLASLNTGKADIAISGISKEPSREKSVNFSDVYYTASNYLVVKIKKWNVETNKKKIKELITECLEFCLLFRIYIDMRDHCHLPVNCAIFCSM